MAAFHGGLKAHLVDPDSRRRAELSRLLAARGIHTEIYEDGDEFRRHSAREGVLLMLDGERQGSIGELVRDIASDSGFLPVVAYSETPEAERIVEALRGGVVDYLSWPIETRLLDRMLDRLVAEFESKVAVERERRRACELVDKLTARERDILVRLIEGAANKEIARDLGISPRTVETYRKNMMAKLQASSLVQAVRIALHAGLWSIASAAEPGVFFLPQADGNGAGPRDGNASSLDAHSFAGEPCDGGETKHIVPSVT